MTDSFGTLIKGSWNFFAAHIKPIFIGSIIFGLLMFGLQKILETQAANSMANHFGDMEKMEEYAERIEQGDEEAFQEMMMKMGMMDEGELDEEAMEDMAMDLMKGMLPMFGLAFFGMLILSLVSSIFYIVLAIEGSQDFIKSMKRIPRFLLPMLGVWIWSFIRSFAWIPVLGWIIAIFVGPRLVMSSVILVKEGKGVTDSVKLSYQRSRGYWGKIVGNSIVAAVLVMLVMFVLSIALGFFGVVSITAAAIVAMILQSMMTAYGAIFVVRLSNTIMANPLQPVATNKKPLS
ncbi:MAG: hypothetical protein QF793_03135 [Candidatus Peribacteraceae bacterium]|jgi:hypothetical protein|nr:hypothetical protein [bacterium]MDP6561897.1 hypothetical protein [Candidatus Peribacteraceae bacterium]|tara:strand:- start:5026 stop:5895 length:870 start_codon:yes stop_codon:yes gene_type:complete